MKDSRTIAALARLMEQHNLTELHVEDIRLVRSAGVTQHSTSQSTPTKPDEPKREEPTNANQETWQLTVDSDPGFRRYMGGKMPI